jgi:hypothetical protein
MATTNLAGIDPATLSKADLQAIVQEQMEQLAEHEALAGVTIEYTSGVSKKGAAFQTVQVWGGDISNSAFAGFKLTPKRWDRLMELIPAISKVIEANRHKFPSKDMPLL